MRRSLTLLTAGALALGALQPALADNDKGKGHGNKGDKGYELDAGDVLLNVAITAAEIAIFHDYIREYGAAAFGPPQGLPPGIAKNLARGKPLPPASPSAICRATCWLACRRGRAMSGAWSTTTSSWWSPPRR